MKKISRRTALRDYRSEAGECKRVYIFVKSTAAGVGIKCTKDGGAGMVSGQTFVPCNFRLPVGC